MQNNKLRENSSRKFDLQRIVVLAVVVVLTAIFSIFSRDFRKFSTVVTLLDLCWVRIRKIWRKTVWFILWRIIIMPQS